MIAKKIYLIRHGKPEYPLNTKGQKLAYGPDVPLSEEGRHDVLTILPQFPPFDTLYVSPFRRTKDTADVIATAQNLHSSKIIQRHNLRDPVPKNIIGLPMEDILAGRAVYEAHKDDETAAVAFDRVLTEFEYLLSRPHTGPVGIVFHGHPIRWILWKYVEGKTHIPSEKDRHILQEQYYVNPAEAVFLEFEGNNLINHRLLHHPENKTPGKRKL